MIKIQKIQDKKTIEVLAQKKDDNFHCTRNGYPYQYVSDGEDCLDDCTASNKPRYFYSKEY